MAALGLQKDVPQVPFVHRNRWADLAAGVESEVDNFIDDGLHGSGDPCGKDHGLPRDDAGIAGLKLRLAWTRALNDAGADYETSEAALYKYVDQTVLHAESQGRKICREQARADGMKLMLRFREFIFNRQS